MIVLTAFEAIPGAGTEAGLAWNWGRSYVAAGHDVTVLTSAGAASHEQSEIWREAGIEVVYIGGIVAARAPQTPRDFVVVAGEIRSWVSGCRAWLETRAADVTMVHHVSWGSVRLPPPFLKVNHPLTTVWGPLGGGQLAKFSGLLPKNRIHELFRAASFPAAWLMRRIDFLSHRYPSLVLATNSATLGYVKSLGIRAVGTMLADGIQPERIVPEPRNGFSAGTVNLIWLGRMVASKRPDIALGLIADLHSKGVSASLTMIGDGPERSSLEVRAESLGVDHLVNFVGRVPWERTFDYYDRSDFLVFTSMRDSSCPTVLEAAARGVPTLCLRHQGVESMVPDSVAFGPTKFRSVKQLQDQLCEWIQYFRADTHRYELASRDAIDFAETQTWGRKVETVLNQVIGVRAS